MKEIQRYNVFRMSRTLRDKAINAVGKLLVPVKSDDGDIVFYTDHLAAIEEVRKQERERMRCATCKHFDEYEKDGEGQCCLKEPYIVKPDFISDPKKYGCIYHMETRQEKTK